MGYGWQPLSYAPRSLHDAVKLLHIYRANFPDNIYVLGRDDAFGRPTLDVDSELRITERLCQPITQSDVFEMCG
jgi:hypothetical protein